MGKHKLTKGALRCWGITEAYRRRPIAVVVDEKKLVDWPTHWWAHVPGHFVPDAPKKRAARVLKGGR